MILLKKQQEMMLEVEKCSEEIYFESKKQNLKKNTARNDA